MNGRDVGRLASRFLAVLLAMQAIKVLPGIVSVLATPHVHLPGGFLAEVLASTLPPLALAVLCWWRAPSVAARLLAPGAEAGAWPAPALEATIFRAVGLYLTLAALVGMVFWISSALWHGFGGSVLSFLLESVVELGAGLATLRWAPDLARRLSGRRRNKGVEP